MQYILYGLILGFIVPYIARRFNKFMPATLGYALYRTIKPVKRTKKTNLKKQALLRKYFYRSVLIGIITSITFYLFYINFGTQGLFAKLLLAWLFILLAEIDTKMMLLPDIITFPLALIGFLISLTPYGFIGPEQSAIAGITGYMLPVIASLFVIWKNKDAFGGGDIKLLAVIGIWGGINILLYTIMLASISFGVYSVIKKQKSGAFGPWLTYSALLFLILFG